MPFRIIVLLPRVITLRIRPFTLHAVHTMCVPQHSAFVLRSIQKGRGRIRLTCTRARFNEQLLHNDISPFAAQTV